MRWKPLFCSKGNENNSHDSYFLYLFISLRFKNSNREEKKARMTREYPRLTHQQ